MIYVQVGLYAEGRSDYDFLIPLLERMLREICTNTCPGNSEIPTPLGVDADAPKGRRRDRIADAVVQNADTCQIFVIHADADGDPGRAREERVDPGVAEARRRLADVGGSNALDTHLIACVPIQMIEAWMLSDQKPFREAFGRDVSVELPKDPEGLSDPKHELDALISRLRRKRPLGLYESFGVNVGLEALRRLSAFRIFEQELEAAVAAMARVNSDHGTRRG